MRHGQFINGVLQWGVMPAVYEPSSELNVLGTYRRCGLPDSVKVSLSQELGDGLLHNKDIGFKTANGWEHCRVKWFPASATFPYQLTFDDDEVLGALLTSESYVEGMDNTCNESSWCVLQRFVVSPDGYSAVLSCPTQKLVDNATGHLTSYFLMFKFSEGWFQGK